MDPVTPAATAAIQESELDLALSSAFENVRMGQMSPEQALKLLRLREDESLRYCVSRLSDPALDAELRPVIFRLLQQAGLVPQFVEQLLKINPDSAKALAKAFQSFERGLDLKLAAHIQSSHAEVILRALELLEVVAESRQLVPLLFSVLHFPDGRVQSKAALLIQKLDTDLVFTKRLMQHSDPRVRANTLQSIAERADTRGLDFLRLGVKDPDSRVRTLAAVGLVRIGDPLGMEALSKMIHSSTAERRSAAWGLGMCGSQDAVALLDLGTQDRDAQVRQLSSAGLKRLHNAD